MAKSNNDQSGCGGVIILVVILIVAFFYKKGSDDESKPISSGYSFTDTATSKTDSGKIAVTPAKTKGKKSKRGQLTRYSNKYQSQPVARYSRPARQYISRSYSSSQCLGRTKKGARCRNMTQSSNGYCWRHGG